MPAFASSAAMIAFVPPLADTPPPVPFPRPAAAYRNHWQAPRRGRNRADGRIGPSGREPQTSSPSQARNSWVPGSCGATVTPGRPRREPQRLAAPERPLLAPRRPARAPAPSRACTAGSAGHRRARRPAAPPRRAVEAAQQELRGVRVVAHPSRRRPCRAAPAACRGREVEHPQQLGDVDVLGGQPAAQHVVRVRHQLDAGAGQVGVQVAGGQVQRLARLPARPG